MRETLRTWCGCAFFFLMPFNVFLLSPSIWFFLFSVQSLAFYFFLFSASSELCQRSITAATAAIIHVNDWRIYAATWYTWTMDRRETMMGRISDQTWSLARTAHWCTRRRIVIWMVVRMNGRTRWNTHTRAPSSRAEHLILKQFLNVTTFYVLRGIDSFSIHAAYDDGRCDCGQERVFHCMCLWECVCVVYPQNISTLTYRVECQSNWLDTAVRLGHTLR